MPQLSLRRDRRARYDGVVVFINEAIEDPIKIVASVFYRPPGQSEIVTNLPPELGIDTSILAIDIDFERRIGKSRRDLEYAGLECEFCHVRPPMT